MFRDKALRCDCGYEVRARDQDAAVQEVRRHAREAHAIEFTVELAREVVRNARLTHDGTTGKEMR